MTYLIKITISITLTLTALAAHMPREEEKSNFNPFFVGRVFKPLDSQHKVVATFSARKEGQRSVKTTEISFRRRVSKQLFYGIESNADLGKRHDDNWVKRNGKWKWNNENSDLEFGSSLFLKFKKGLYFLPGTNWVGELNLKTHNNWTHTLLTLKPEASLTYMHFKGGKPQYNLFLKYKTYIPLNYSQEDIYETWTYLGYLYHYKKRIKPSIFIAYKSQKWTTSQEYEDLHSDERYVSKSNLSYIGLGVNFYY